MSHIGEIATIDYSALVRSQETDSELQALLKKGSSLKLQTII